MNNRIENINVENAKITFKNFSGRATKFSPKGLRSFSLILDQDMADKLEKDGWNVRYLNPREEGDLPTPILDVKVRVDEDTPIPAEVYLIQDGYKHRLYEDSIGMLDEMTFDNIDLIIISQIYCDVRSVFIIFLYSFGKKSRIANQYFSTWRI